MSNPTTTPFPLTDDDLSAYERNAERMQDLARLRALRSNPNLPELLQLLEARREQADCGYIHAPGRWKSRLELYELAIAVLTGGSDA